MLYPMYVRTSSGAYSVIIPDFPVCFSASENWQDLPRLAQDSIELWCDGLAIDLPNPTPLDNLLENPNFTGGAWMLINIGIATKSPEPVRIKITVPQSLLLEIDNYAEAKGTSRSAFFSDAALQMLPKT